MRIFWMRNPHAPTGYGRGRQWRSPRLRGHWDPYRIVSPPERVLHTETHSWREIPSLLSRQILLVVLGAALLAVAGRRSLTTLAWLVIGIAAIQMITKLLRWWLTTYVVTTARLLLVKGVWTRRLQTIPLSRIAQVHYSQTLLERVFGGATVKVIAAGQEDAIELRGLATPDLFHYTLTSTIARVEAGRYDDAGPAPGDTTIEFGPVDR